MEYKVLCSIVVFYPKNNATDEKVVSETKTRWGEPVCSHKMMQYAAYNKGRTHRSAPTIVSNLPPQRAINLPPQHCCSSLFAKEGQFLSSSDLTTLCVLETLGFEQTSDFTFQFFQISSLPSGCPRHSRGNANRGVQPLPAAPPCPRCRSR